jgi:hypothetical protein
MSEHTNSFKEYVASFLAPRVKKGLDSGRIGPIIAYEAKLLRKLNDSPETQELFADAYVSLFRKTKNPYYLIAAKECLEKPLQGASKEYDDVLKSGTKDAAKLIHASLAVSRASRKYAMKFPKKELESLGNVEINGNLIKIGYNGSARVFKSSKGAIEDAEAIEKSARAYVERFSNGSSNEETVEVAKALAELNDGNADYHLLAANALFGLYNINNRLQIIEESNKYIDRALELARTLKERKDIFAQKERIYAAYKGKKESIDNEIGMCIGNAFNDYQDRKNIPKDVVIEKPETMALPTEAEKEVIVTSAKSGNPVEMIDIPKIVDQKEPLDNGLKENADLHTPKRPNWSNIRYT